MNTKTSTRDFNLSRNERLNLSNASPFTPKNIKNLIPVGMKFFSFNAGFKKKNKDLLIVVFDELVNVHSVYSLTSTPSAPIIWDKKTNRGKCKALILNSGNANAHTGKEGIKIIDKYVNELVKKNKLNKNQILVSSTGVIGEIFDPSLIINSIKKIDKTKPTDLIGAAESIMTTDTYAKTSIKNIKLKNINFKIYGFAKGSGMIQPNLGTMLAYIFIECSLTQTQLKKLTNFNIQNTFNSISVDSDTSTSDTLMLFSVSEKKIDTRNKKNFNILSNGLFEVMKDLSYQIIKDGEGLSKIIEVDVIKARSINQAEKIAFSIVNSPLVKTAIAGEDANWGRVIMAIGKSYEKINQNKIKLKFGKQLVSNNGEIYKKINHKKLIQYMKKNVINIEVDLGIGIYSKRVIGNDLTYNYVRINADYRS